MLLIVVVKNKKTISTGFKSMNWTLWLLLIGLGAVLAFVAGRLVVQWGSARPDNLAGAGGKLAACPDSPNCVSTLSDDSTHQISPLPLGDTEAGTRARLVEAIEIMDRSTIVTNRPGYLHVEFKSAFWGFVDDLEFVIDEESGVIHSRSAARMGYSDLGVNRQRYETIRRAYTAGN